MKRAPVLLIILFLWACNRHLTNSNSAGSTHAEKSTSDTAPKYGAMKQYWLIFLFKGENRKHDSLSSVRIQAAHIANIERLASEKIIIMAGPMGYKTPKDLRGIFIMDAKDSATAASYIQTDSAVITGRLRFEIHPWWTARGTYKFE